MIRFLASLCLLLLSCAAAPARADPVTVFAAASLRDALTDIARLHPDPVRFAFGGSGGIARQVAAGAPADVVVLAHADWMRWLDTRGLLYGAPVDIATNTLVLVGAPGADPIGPTAPALLAALAGGRLAIGQRDAVPAGIYAREWLEHIDAWDTLAPHLAETDNVRAALALVAQGAAPLGVVYASDAVAEPRVKVLHAIAPGQHSPITYPAAALTERGRTFLTRLRSAEASAILTAHGFAPPVAR